MFRFGNEVNFTGNNTFISFILFILKYLLFGRNFHYLLTIGKLKMIVILVKEFKA